MDTATIDKEKMQQDAATYVKVYGKLDRSPEYLNAALFAAVRDSNLTDEDICRLFLKGDPNHVEKSLNIKEMGDGINKFLLIEAIALGRKKELIERFLKCGAQVNVRDGLGNTTLHKAARSNDLKVASLLVENKAEVNLKNVFNELPLHAAAGSNDLKVASLLLKNKAEVNGRDSFGNTALHTAVKLKHLEMASLLLENNTYIDAKDSFGNIIKRTRNNAYLYITDSSGKPPLHKAVELNDLAMASLLLKSDVNGYIEDASGSIIMNVKNKANVNFKDSSGNTPLHTAVELNHPAMAWLLLENNADVNTKNILGETPLHKVLKEVNTEKALEMFDFLFRAAASNEKNNVAAAAPTPLDNEVPMLLNNEAPTPLNNEALTPLLDIVTSSASERAPLFYARALFIDPDVKKPDGIIPENEKIWDDHRKELAAIQNYYFSDGKGNSLYDLCKGKNLDLALREMKYSEANFKDLLERSDIKSKFPLSISHMRSHLEQVLAEKVLETKIKVLETKRMEERINQSSFFVNFDAFVPGEDVTAVRELENAQAHSTQAQTSSSQLAMPRLNENASQLKKDIEMFVNVDKELGDSPELVRCVLFEKIKQDQVDGIKDLLIRAGDKADVNAQDENGNTAVHAAVMNVRLETLSLLLKGDADVNAKNNSDITPLNAAIYGLSKLGEKGEPIANLLLQYGADPLVKDKSNLMPIDLARNPNPDFKKITELLQAHILFKNPEAEKPDGITPENDKQWNLFRDEAKVIKETVLKDDKDCSLYDLFEKKNLDSTSTQSGKAGLKRRLQPRKVDLKSQIEAIKNAKNTDNTEKFPLYSACIKDLQERLEPKKVRKITSRFEDCSLFTQPAYADIERPLSDSEKKACSSRLASSSGY